jgi:hypothetical protein
MNRLKKGPCLLALLLLIAISVLAQTPWVSFGPPDDPKARRGVGFERYQGLRVVAPDVRNRGLNVIRDPNMLRQTGGGMLVSVAEPHPDLANQRLSLAYDPSREDGNRFEISIGDQKAYMDLFDWEAKPLVQFVSSGHHGAINVSSRYNGDEITLDDAFQGRLLGLRFIQADYLPIADIASQKYLPRGMNGLFILGNGERQWLGRVSSVQTAEETLEPLFSDGRTAHRTQYVVLTDAGKRFTFSLSNGGLVLDGTPYYLFWEPRGDRVVPNHSLTNRFNDSWPSFRLVNPLVIRAVERAFRTTAFFRYQQQNNPSNWTAFAQRVSSISIPTVPTPRILQVAGSGQRKTVE